MDENKNIFNPQQDDIGEAISEPARAETAEITSAPEEVSDNSAVVDADIIQEQEKQPEGEIEIDPAIENYAGEQPVSNIYDQQGTANFDPFAEEPMAPIMPQIKTNPYVPTGKKSSNHGMKVFAVIIALLVLISGCITGGYFLGLRNGGSFDGTDVDLAAKPVPENALTVSEIYSEINPSIVGIYVYNSKGIAGSASGVIYSKDGYVVTNDHIYSSVASPKFKVYTSDGQSFDADFVAGDTRSDLAVLKIKNATGLTPAIFGNSDQVVVGETAVAVGRPNGATEKSIASEGVISAVNRRAAITSSYTGKYIQTDSAINPGSSGGALCNIYGQVIGITSAKLVGDEYEGVGFAIPTTVMKKNVELLIKNGYVKGRAKLGISYLAVDELTAQINSTPAGLQIASIDKSSDLYGKSVEIGDIITKVNGIDILTSSTILDVIDNKTAGDTLILTVYSSTKKISFDVTVKLLEDEGGSSFNSSVNNSSDESDGDDEDYNQSEFNFPNGD